MIMFLELGFGRGEFLNEFSKLGLDFMVLILSRNAGSLSEKKIKIKTGINVEQDKWFSIIILKFQQ